MRWWSFLLRHHSLSLVIGQMGLRSATVAICNWWNRVKVCHSSTHITCRQIRMLLSRSKELELRVCMVVGWPIQVELAGRGWAWILALVPFAGYLCWEAYQTDDLQKFPKDVTTRTLTTVGINSGIQDKYKVAIAMATVAEVPKSTVYPIALDPSYIASIIFVLVGKTCSKQWSTPA